MIVIDYICATTALATEAEILFFINRKQMIIAERPWCRIFWNMRQDKPSGYYEAAETSLTEFIKVITDYFKSIFKFAAVCEDRLQL